MTGGARLLGDCSRAPDRYVEEVRIPGDMVGYEPEIRTCPTPLGRV